MKKNIFKVLGIQEKLLNSKITQEISFPLSQQTEEQINKLGDTLRYDKGIYEKQAIAVSANQAGIDKRFFIIGNLRNPRNMLRKLEVYINPTIIEYGNEQDNIEEGCISIPRYVCKVERPTSVVVQYQNLQGDYMKAEFVDLQARIFQHEYDHLEGIHMLQRTKQIELNPLWDNFLKKLKKQKRDKILQEDPLYQEYGEQIFQQNFQL